VGSELGIMKTRRYGVDNLDFIRQALAGYAGGSAIVSEILQNADDAGATKAVFQFHPQALLAWNDSTFSNRDWENLTSIASGGKRDEKGKIGTWGTGFLSVFHITDLPQISSAGEKLIIDPRLQELDVYKLDFSDGTGIKLTWRRELSDISHAIEAGVWHDEDIDKLKADLATAIYRQIIFLRHVSTIEVYEGNRWQEKLLYSVTRTSQAPVDHGGYQCEEREVEYYRTGTQLRQDTWMYYWSDVPRSLMVEGVTFKDTKVGIAFPVENRDWLAKNLPGTLYNFLPTPIETGYAFHINGAFFPDSSRRTILMDPQTHREKTQWNQNVIRSIGRLFVLALPDIRDRLVDSHSSVQDQFGAARRFYELLPTQAPSSGKEFLTPIHEVFRSEAPLKEIILSSRGAWSRPREVSIGRPGSRLPELVADYLPIVPPTGLPQAYRDFLSVTLGVQPLVWKDAVRVLKQHSKPGVLVADAYPMIHSIEKLESLYSELPPNPSREDRQFLTDANICLGIDGKLWPFSADIWCASEETRKLLAGTDLLFVPAWVQEKYGLFEAMLGELRGAEFVEWLARRPWPDTPIPSYRMPVALRDLDHLADLVDFIYADLQRLDRALLANLPIIYTEDSFLCKAVDEVYFHTDAGERSRLQALGLRFVDPAWAQGEAARAVYTKAGVSDLMPRHVIRSLGETTLSTTDSDRAGLVERLLGLYNYFYRNQNSLSAEDRTQLRALPLCLTQGGRLTSVQQEQGPLHLPGTEVTSRSPALRSLDRLQLDHLVHSEVLSARGFLTEILGLKSLSEVALIREVILKYYHDSRLTDADRRSLLQYIGEQLRSLPEIQREELWPALRRSSLILCSNGEYHPGRDVYFASPAIETVFGPDYLKLHSSYGVPVAQPDDVDEAPYRQSVWYWLFECLLVNEAPAPRDLLGAIQRLTATSSPSDDRIEPIRRLYEFLNREISTNKIYTHSAEIRQLADCAWLPARDRSDRWYKPREIYQASVASFVGDQAPLMRFAESSRELRSILDMPSYPDVKVVAEHLLSLAVHQRPLPDLRIYEDLGNRWDEIVVPLREQMKTQATVWSEVNKHYWNPRNVFLEDYSSRFGKRRSYLRPPGGNAQQFLFNIGVRTSPDAWGDSLALLSEIAATYSNGHRIDPEDAQLIWVNLDILSRYAHEVNGQLETVAFCPADDGTLHRPSHIVLVDRVELLNKFNLSTFVHKKVGDLPDTIVRFLRGLGAPLLSEVTHRRLLGVEGKQPDASLTYRIQNLSLPLKRVARHQYDDDEVGMTDAFERIDRLVSFGIYTCSRITVEYFIRHDGLPETVGYSDNNDKSLLDDATQSFYVRRERGRESDTALALEIEALLFPRGKASVIIERLLEKQPAELDAYLDSHNYPRLPNQDRLLAGRTPSSGAIEEWNISDAPIAPAEDKLSTDLADQSDEVTLTPRQLSLEEAEAEPHSTEAAKSENEEEEPGVYLIGGAEPKTRDVASKPSKVDPQDEPPDGSLLTEIPPFTSPLHMATPVLPNDYIELHKRYGLALDGTEASEDHNILNSDRVESDQVWSSVPDKDEEGAAVTTVRFTLTFLNRYRGFLPLHSRARLLLQDRPLRLTCLAEATDREFDLCVDYQRGILYNERELSRLFEAHNIPAGGIVYLERVHGDHCRLYWKQSMSQVENVICLELHDDGTLDEFEIPSTEFPCEIAEYILRSEKRLEDVDALFQQAIGKRGVFHTICDVFGEPGRVMSFDEIYHGVAKIRQVSTTSIVYQLSQRPCFVHEPDDLWRFAPELGHKRKQESPPKQPTGKKMSGGQLRRAVGGPALPTDSKKIPAPPRPALSPSALLLNEMRSGWAELGKMLQEDGCSDRLLFTRWIDRVMSLAAQWQSRLQAVFADHVEVDNVLSSVWERVAREPLNRESTDLLTQRLLELVLSERIDGLIAQLRRLLASTSAEVHPVFHTCLAAVADRCFEDEHWDQASQLYQLLQSENAGDFQVRIDLIAEQEQVRARLADVDTEPDLNDRLILLRVAWDESSGHPIVARAIHDQMTAVFVNRKGDHLMIEKGTTLVMV